MKFREYLENEELNESNKKSVKFYTDSGRYMGKKNLTSYQKDFLELKSWLDSGNEIEFDGKRIKSASEIKKIY